MNFTTASTESNLYNEHLAFKVTTTFLYVVILILSLIGNAMVVIIICRFKHLKRVPGNLFIVNLALCDLLTPLISIPLEIAEVENNYEWPLDAASCKLLPPSATLFATSSSLTLAAISLDRYRTLMHPFKQRLDARTVKILIASVHCCSLVLVAPYTITLQLSPSGQCVEVWPGEILPKIYTSVLFLGQYALPLIFMAVMYIHAARNLFETTNRARSMSCSSASSSGKRRGSLKHDFGPKEGNSRDYLENYFRKHSEHNAQVTKFFIAIVVVFAVFTLPIEVLWIWGEFAGGGNHRLYPTVAAICRLFTYANSCLNPIIFYKFNREFHGGFVAFFRHPSSCRDDNSLTRANGAYGGNGRNTPSWFTPRVSFQSTPRFLTPRGSFQSASRHSVSFVDNPSKTSHDNKVENFLNIPHSNYDSVCQLPSVDNLNSGNSEDTKVANYLCANQLDCPVSNDASNPCISNTNCNISIKVCFYECDLTIELDKLESLLVLPQTDC